MKDYFPFWEDSGMQIELLKLIVSTHKAWKEAYTIKWRVYTKLRQIDDIFIQTTLKYL